MTDKVGLNETEYLDLVERVQRAMCIEPFCPDVTDVVVLIGTVRMLDREIKRLRAALEWVRDDTELWDAPIVLDALAGSREDEPEQAHRSETASP